MSGMKAVLLLAASVWALAAGPFAPAAAQGGTSALKGHNSNAPVDWTADRIEVQDRADRVVLSGNVVAKQAELTLNAPRVTVAYTNDKAVQIQRIDASGGVLLTSPTETARGQFAIYDLGKRLITMLGGVTLTRSDSNVRGNRLVFDLATGRAVVDGGGSSTAKAPGGRVSGSFTVTQRPKQAPGT